MFNTGYRYAMDYDFVLRLFINGRSFNYIPHVLTNMRWEGISDKQWFSACKEVLMIKNSSFPNRKLKNRLHFIKQVGAIRMGKVLQQLHLGSLVRFYRSKLSPVKKIYQ